jgi:hypothetical protein
MEDATYLNVKDSARYLGVSRSTIWTYRRRCLLPNRPRWTRAELDECAAKLRPQPARRESEAVVEASPAPERDFLDEFFEWVFPFRW